MKNFKQYWTFSAIRGALTVIVAAGIAAVPQAATAILSIPVTLGFAIDVLAVYILLDAGAMFLLAIVMPAQARNRRVLFVQAAAAVFFGTVLYLFTYGAINPRYLLLCVASYAAVMAVVEIFVARDTHAQYGCTSCFSTAMVLAASALALPFASGLDAAGTSVVLAGFVGIYGVSQLLLAARMLVLDYRAGHPAAVLSEAWRAEMVSPATFSCIACEACPADATCRDYSLPGQVARIRASRQPAIVRTVRVASLMEPAGIYRSR
jgi:hypothetical protein